MIAKRIIDRSIIQPIMAFRFDDGYARIYTDVYPLFKKYGVIGTICVIPVNVDQPNYLSCAQIQELLDNGWSLAYHGPHTAGKEWKLSNYPTADSVVTTIAADWKIFTDKMKAAGFPEPPLPKMTVYLSHILERSLVPALSRIFEYGTSPVTSGGADFNADSPSAYPSNTNWAGSWRVMRWIHRYHLEGRFRLPREGYVATYEDLGTVVAGRKPATSFMSHVNGVDIGGKSWDDATQRAQLLASMETALRTMIAGGTVFVSLYEWAKYYCDPTNPHLTLPWRDLMPDKYQYQIATDGNWLNGIKNTFSIVSDPDTSDPCPTGYPIVKLTGQTGSWYTAFRPGRWYALRFWAKSGTAPVRGWVRAFENTPTAEGPMIYDSTSFYANAGGDSAAASKWHQCLVWVDSRKFTTEALEVYFHYNYGTCYLSKPELIEIPDDAINRLNNTVTFPEKLGGQTYTLGVNVL